MCVCVCVWSLLVSCLSKLLRDRLLLLVHSLFVALYAGALFLLSWCFRSRETTRLIRDGPVHSLKLVPLEHTKHTDRDDYSRLLSDIASPTSLP